MRATLFLSGLAVLVALSAGTSVNECGSGIILEDTEQVQITNCDAPPCKLRKNTKVSIQQKFTPAQDIQNLKTSVHASILGVALPFLGVDGTDACGKIFTVADGQPAACPLKKGVEYVYKNEFPILKIYPSVSLTVHWALKEDNKIVTCFEVPSRII